MAKKNETEIINTYLHGKVPPQDREMEEAVLGALLIEKDAILEVSHILKPEVFYVSANEIIYAAIMSLFANSHPVDLLTVSDALKRIGKLEEVGGVYYLSQLTNKVASSANVVYHAQIIVQYYIKRELIKQANKAIAESYDDTVDPFELIESHENSVSNIISFKNSRKTQTLYSLAKQSVMEAEGLRGQNLEYLGVPTGLYEVDRITGGWRNGDLIIIAARPSMGKTAFMCCIAANAAERGCPVGVISLEMPGTQIASRILSFRTNMNLMKFRNAKYNDDEYSLLADHVEQMRDIPLHVDDSCDVNLVNLKAIIRKLVVKNGCKLILIDQLNHINHTEKNRTRDNEVGTITRTLKAAAREHDIPVILLHQLNRGVEQRGGEKKPNLGDLRDSGNVEQDADIVAFLYRPEYYGIHEDKDGNSLAGIAEVIFAKHRNGVVGSVPVGFKKELTLFHNINDVYEIQNNTPSSLTGTEPDLPF